MKFEMKVDGLKELEANLLKLDKAVGVRILRASVRGAAKAMLAKATRLAPYDINDPDGSDGYHLRNSMKLQQEPSRTRKALAQFRLGPARETQVGGDRAIKGGLGKSSKSPNYAHLAEKDTPFLRPAFDTEHKGFIVEFKRLMAKKIASAMKKAGV